MQRTLVGEACAPGLGRTADRHSAADATISSGFDAGVPWRTRRAAALWPCWWPRLRHLRHNAGITLVELLFVVAIAGVLMGVAAPAAIDMRDRAALRSATHLLHADLNFTRGEAVRRHTYVSMCPSDDGRACSDRDWQAGWIVFEDPERLGEPSHPDRIIRVQYALPPRLSLIGNTPIRRHLGFNALGVTRARNGALLMGTLSLCHARRDVGHALVINRSGRVRHEARRCQVES